MSADIDLRRLAGFLKLANATLEKHRFAGMDQNPKGIQDLIGSAALQVGRMVDALPKAGESKSDRHNRITREVLTKLDELQPDGTTALLVVLESILAGVLLAKVKPGGEDPVLSDLLANAKRRAVEIRALHDAAVPGSGVPS